MANISLRGAEITGINHNRDQQEFMMHAQLQSGEKCQLVFQTVAWWELCSFGVENILSTIEAYNEQSLTEAVIDEQDIGDQHLSMVREGATLFVLQASAGLSGWIIADKMVVKASGKKG